MFRRPGRRVEYTSDVQDEILRQIAVHQRLGDVVLAIEELLKHDPWDPKSQIVRPANGLEVRVIRTEREYGAPGVTLVYEIEGDTLTVFGIVID